MRYDQRVLVLYAAYDPRSGALEYCNCGHLPGLIRRPGGVVETLPVGGLPVGLFEPMKMTVHKVQLQPGDLFFLYTDGVTEAEDPEALQFGEDRLEGLLTKKGHGAGPCNGLRASRRQCASSRADALSSTTSPASR
jgi:phosphoserine phosphatase RsbU/P